MHKNRDKQAFGCRGDHVELEVKDLLAEAWG